MKVGVLGLGISGLAALKFLGNEAIGIDRKERIAKLSLPNPLFDEREFHERLDLLVISPGIALTHPICRLADEVIGEVELAARHAKGCLIGVTGTNGKTTSVRLIAHVLGAKCVGNVGDPLINHTKEKGTLVVELSSYQLETMESAVWDTSLILNLTPDHLERHQSMEVYKAIKLKLASLTRNATFINRMIEKSRYNFGPGVTQYEWMDGEMLEFLSYIKERPSKEAEMLAGIFAVVKQYGTSLSAFLEALATFQRPEHRLEFVRELDEIEFYNDSKATNIDSVDYAVEALVGEKILLVGGKDKGISFSTWNDSFDGSVREVIAFGEAAAKIKRELNRNVISTKTMEDALLEAMKLAKAHDKIVLSPGCSSFDSFQNFEERGSEFKRLVRNLCREKTSS